MLRIVEVPRCQLKDRFKLTDGRGAESLDAAQVARLSKGALLVTLLIRPFDVLLVLYLEFL